MNLPLLPPLLRLVCRRGCLGAPEDGRRLYFRLTVPECEFVSREMSMKGRFMDLQALRPSLLMRDG